MKPLPASESSKPSYQLRWAGEGHAITPAEKEGTTLLPSLNSPETLPEQVPHQPCCSRVLTKHWYHEGRTSPPTPSPWFPAAPSDHRAALGAAPLGVTSLCTQKWEPEGRESGTLAERSPLRTGLQDTTGWLQLHPVKSI